MKYLCLICAEKVMEQMPQADADKHYEEYREFTGSIRKSGHFVDCNGYCRHQQPLRSGCARAKFPARMVLLLKRKNSSVAIM